MKRFLVFTIVLAALLGALRSARALDRNFAGSAQLDWHLVPKSSSALPERQIPLDGFTTEAALKVSVDVTDRLWANVKACFGCHGFELAMAHVDYRFADEFSIRVGRFSPSFGSFNLRHDPANHRLSSKPLPYDMGRMLRMREWNLGVLPSPFPDNGVEVNGTHWFGLRTQLDYAVYAVNGFRGDASGQDLDFQASRSRDAYYSDNNGRPTLGARAALTMKLSQLGDLTFGASAMHGKFDPDRRLSYTIMGADVVLRLRRTNIRAEWLARKQELDVSDPSQYRYATLDGGNFFIKHGAYVEIEQPLSSRVDLIARVDGLYRKGNVVLDSPLRRQSAVLRYTLGTTFIIERGLRMKLSTEIWDFSDAGRSGRNLDVGVHAGMVGTF